MMPLEIQNERTFWDNYTFTPFSQSRGDDMTHWVKELHTKLSKYPTTIPRYTSYPTAVELRPLADFPNGEDIITTSLEKASSLSLYVHLPYCPSLCYFCACNKIINPDPEVIWHYLDLLELECDLLTRQRQTPLSLVELHLGGGSPSYLSSEQLLRLHEILERYFIFDTVCERSVELDPRTTTGDKVKVFSELGYLRASLGIQDFDPEVQEAVHREQPFELVCQVYELLTQHGFESINFDLLYGLPRQTLETFSKTLERVIKFRPHRIALYGYAHLRNRVKVQRTMEKYGLPSSTDRLELFSLALERLGDAGYEYIGLDHFVLPEDRLAEARNNKELRRNFMGYTTVSGEGVLGLGVSSISDIGGVLFQNAPGVEIYEKALHQGTVPVSRLLVRSEEDRVRAVFIERIMCHREVELSEVVKATGNLSLCQEVYESALPALNAYTQDGFLELAGETLKVTDLGAYALRYIAAAFDGNLKSLSGEVVGRFSTAV